MEKYRLYVAEELKQLDYAPIVFVTANEGRQVQTVIDSTQRLFKQANVRLTTGKLNQAVRQILDERRPPTPTGRRARVYYATQTEVAPPTIVLFVNNPKLIDEKYQRYMINRFREMLPYSQVPIRLIIRGREGRPVKDALDGGDAATKPVKRRPPAKKKGGRRR